MSSAISVARVRESPFRETDWDRKLDNMLEDLGGTGGPLTTNGTSMMTQQSYSSSSTQQMSFNSQQGMKSQQSSSSSSQHRTVMGGGHPRMIGLDKSGSIVSMKDSADGVLKDLEDGLVKSTSYIQESHGGHESREVRPRDIGDTFNLEQSVQHMIPIGRQDTNQLTTYKVQANQYTEAELDQDERPGSRLKQNIDELDTLLYDLNNARNLSPDNIEQEYSAPSHATGLDSDDYDETVGSTGHVKRAVSAFNEYSQQISDPSRKPPSPSPRRRGNQPSPPVVRKTQHSSTMSQNQQNMTINQTSSSQQSQSYQYQTDDKPVTPVLSYQPPTGPPGSNQAFNYISGDISPAITPDPNHPSFYTKYNSTKTINNHHETTGVPFPSQTTRSPTPQNPPKRVDELMSEFQEFDCGQSGGSPTPQMFSKPPKNTTLEVTELPDEAPNHVKVDPIPYIKEPSPPPAQPTPAPKGPDVYYPPGAEFKAKPVEPPAHSPAHPIGDGGSLSLAGEKRGARSTKGHERGADSGEKQGAAVIPICLPLCCAAPCVIM